MTPDKIVQPFAVLFGIGVVVGALWLLEFGALNIFDPDIPAWTKECPVQKIGRSNSLVALEADCDGEAVTVTASGTIVEYLNGEGANTGSGLTCTKLVSQVLEKVSYSCGIVERPEVAKLAAE